MKMKNNISISAVLVIALMVVLALTGCGGGGGNTGTPTSPTPNETLDNIAPPSPNGSGLVPPGQLDDEEMGSWETASVNQGQRVASAALGFLQPIETTVLQFPFDRVLKVTQAAGGSYSHTGGLWHSVDVNDASFAGDIVTRMIAPGEGRACTYSNLSWAGNPSLIVFTDYAAGFPNALLVAHQCGSYDAPETASPLTAIGWYSRSCWTGVGTGAHAHIQAISVNTTLDSCPSRTAVTTAINNSFPIEFALDIKTSGSTEYVPQIVRSYDLKVSDWVRFSPVAQVGYGFSEDARVEFQDAYEEHGGVVNIGIPLVRNSTGTYADIYGDTGKYQEFETQYWETTYLIQGNGNEPLPVRLGFAEMYPVKDRYDTQRVLWELVGAPKTAELFKSSPAQTGSSYSYQQFEHGAFFWVGESPFQWLTTYRKQVLQGAAFFRWLELKQQIGIPVSAQYHDPAPPFDTDPNSPWRYSKIWFEKGFIWIAKHKTYDMVYTYAFRTSRTVFDSNPGWIAIDNAWRRL